jgi:hypothetical protein
MKKTDWDTIMFVVAVVLLVCEVMGFGYGIFLFMSGFHSLDLAQDVNHVILSMGGDPNLVKECNLGGQCTSLMDTYLEGATRLFEGFITTIAMTILFMTTLFLIIELARGKHK